MAIRTILFPGIAPNAVNTIVSTAAANVYANTAYANTVANSATLLVYANTAYANSVANGASTSTPNTTITWYSPQRANVVALANSGATVNANLSLSNDFSLNMIGNNAWTLANPAGQGTANGQSGHILIWNPLGGATLAFGSNWKPVGNTTPTLTAAANTMDLLCYRVESGPRIMYNLIKGFL
ncbi:MAG: hypothetical protein WCK82_12875 [Bacteroidota bacterium]|jgi:hypothetical protein